MSGANVRPVVAESQQTASPPLQVAKRRAEGIATKPRPADRREKRFAFLIAQGWSMWRAYNAVSGAKNKDTCEKQGQRWCAREAIRQEIAKQRGLLTEE